MFVQCLCLFMGGVERFNISNPLGTININTSLLIVKQRCHNFSAAAKSDSGSDDEEGQQEEEEDDEGGYMHEISKLRKKFQKAKFNHNPGKDAYKELGKKWLGNVQWVGQIVCCLMK